MCKGGQMHTIRFKLETTAYHEEALEKRFHALSHVHNVMVKHAKKLLKQLKFHKGYQEFRRQYSQLKEDKEMPTEEKQRRREQLSGAMKEIRKKMGLSDAGFQSYLKVCGKRFSKCLSSQQVQKEASRVWAGARKVLFSDGKDIHFKKYMDFDTIAGKTNTNGVQFDKDTLSIAWLGLTVPCRQPRKPADAIYTAESLDHKISYCEIVRKMFPDGWHYYVTVYLDGDAPVKHKCSQDAARNCMGIDPGVSAMAGVSGTTAVLEELAPGCHEYARKIARLQVKMDHSRRLSNPEKYDQDGRVKKGCKGKWVYSNTYRKDRRRLKSLFRQKAAYTKQSHRELINRLLDDSLHFIVEDMSYKALQKRSKKTERQEKASDVTQKDGTTKKVYKYKRKKRFGKSLNSRSPALFLSFLEQKALLCGGSFVKVKTKSYKASQYDHTTDSYVKVPLSQRSKAIGGHDVQRDLYSAFLIRNSNETYDHPDRARCIRDFDGFLDMQSRLLADMKSRQMSMKQCFGF